MSDAHQGYSEKFREAIAASEYERFYTPGTADHAIWTHERKILTDLLARHQKHWPTCNYLDFACGTGRVIEFMESRVTTSRGIDISSEMLRLAAPKLQRSELICTDITKSDVPEAKYDLITAFRFFLNAEPSLRLAVMRALALRLKNAESVLVFTNHGNPFSYKGAMWPVHRIKQLLEQLGLHIVERFGCGIISPRFFKIAPSMADSIESRFGGGDKVARAIGVNQVYVVSKTSS